MAVEEQEPMDEATDAGILVVAPRDFLLHLVQLAVWESESGEVGESWRGAHRGVKLSDYQVVGL